MVTEAIQRRVRQLGLRKAHDGQDVELGLLLKYGMQLPEANVSRLQGLYCIINTERVLYGLCSQLARRQQVHL